VGNLESRKAAMTSIIPFLGNAVFEAADIKLMSDAYRSAIEAVYEFGRPNKIVEKIMAARIITLTRGGERDLQRLHEKALAACGFKAAKHSL
jgi:hypothetical protein